MSRPVLAVPTALLLLCGLTACGAGDAGAGSSAQPTAAAEQATPSEAPAGDVLDATTFTAAVTDAYLASGSYDFAMTSTNGEHTVRATGSAHLGDSPTVRLVMELPGTTVETRQTGGLTYMNLGAITDGKFLEIDPDDTSNPMAAGVKDSMEGLDPTKGLAEHEAAIVSVTRTAEGEQVEGTDVDVYEVVVDPSKMPEQLAELQESLPEGAEVPETITYVYSLDADARVVRLTYAILDTNAEMLFTNYGAAAAVVAPTAEEITTMESVVG